MTTERDIRNQIRYAEKKVMEKGVEKVAHVDHIDRIGHVDLALVHIVEQIGYLGMNRDRYSRSDGLQA